MLYYGQLKKDNKIKIIINFQLLSEKYTKKIKIFGVWYEI